MDVTGQRSHPARRVPYDPVQLTAAWIDEDVAHGRRETLEVDAALRTVVPEGHRTGVLTIEVGPPPDGLVVTKAAGRQRRGRAIVDLAAPRVESHTGQRAIGIDDRLDAGPVQVGAFDLVRLLPVELASITVDRHAARAVQPAEHGLHARSVQGGAFDGGAGHPIHTAARFVQRQATRRVAGRRRHQHLDFGAVDGVGAHDTAAGRGVEAVGGCTPRRTVVVGVAGAHEGCGQLDPVDAARQVDAVQPLRLPRPRQRIVGARDGRVSTGELQVVLGQVEVLGIADIRGLAGAAHTAVANGQPQARRRGVDLAAPLVPGDALAVAVVEHVRTGQVDLVVALQPLRDLRRPGGGQDAGAGWCDGDGVPGLVKTRHLRCAQREGEDLDFVEHAGQACAGGLGGFAKEDAAFAHVTRCGLEATGHQLAVDVELLAAGTDDVRHHVPLVVAVVDVGRTDALAAAVEHVDADVATTQVDLAIGAKGAADQRTHAGNPAVAARRFEPLGEGVTAGLHGHGVGAHDLPADRRAVELDGAAETPGHAGRGAGGGRAQRHAVLARVVAEEPRPRQVIQVEQQQGIAVDVGDDIGRVGDLGAADAGLDRIGLGEHAADVQGARDACNRRHVARRCVGRDLVEASAGRCAVQAHRAGGIGGAGGLVARLVDSAHLHVVETGRVALAEVRQGVVDGPVDLVAARRRNLRILPAGTVGCDEHLHPLDPADAGSTAGIVGGAGEVNDPALVGTLAGGDDGSRDGGCHRGRLAVDVEHGRGGRGLHETDGVGGADGHRVSALGGRHIPGQGPGVTRIAARQHAHRLGNLPGAVIDAHLHTGDGRRGITGQAAQHDGAAGRHKLRGQAGGWAVVVDEQAQRPRLVEAAHVDGRSGGVDGQQRAIGAPADRRGA